MALVQAQDADKRPSTALTLDFQSNNPFRNRAASPSSFSILPSPQSLNFNIQSAPPERPRSRNPFLDDTEQPDIFAPQPQHVVPHKAMSGELSSPVKGGLYGNSADLFNNLAIDDRPAPNGTDQAPPPVSSGPSRSENIPPPQRKFGPSLQHQLKSKEEEQQRLRGGARPRGSPQTLDVFADPPSTAPRLRRNSDSSLADKNKVLSSDEERKRRERRHREREARHRDMDGKPRLPGAKKPSRRLDVIDQLDLTGIYGTGLVHHDGPFDACNPHRNRKGSQRAPMKAFAKDSLNNALGGSGPVNKDIDLERFHGRGEEGFTDFSKSGAANPIAEPVAFEPYAGASAGNRYARDVRPGVDRASSFNPTDKVEPVHGDLSLGLGTSTFLEGAPAPRSVMQRRESESDNTGTSGGLGRKKSLVQKIRSINRSDRTVAPGPRSPEVYDRAPASPGSPPRQLMSAGGMPRIREKTYPPTNPFFTNYNDAYEKKGANIQIAEEQNRDDAGGSGRERAISSPKKWPMPGQLERRVTHDGSPAVEEGKSSGGGGGFLSRVKSLKGGPRRGRPDKA